MICLGLEADRVAVEYRDVIGRPCSREYEVVIGGWVTVDVRGAFGTKSLGSELVTRRGFASVRRC